MLRLGALGSPRNQALCMIGSMRSSGIMSVIMAATLVGCSTAKQDAKAPQPDVTIEAIPPERLTLADVESAHVQAWRKIPKRLDSRVAIPLAASDLLEFRDWVAKADVLDGDQKGMFIGSENGVLHTSQGEFEFFVGSEKIATRTYRATIRPFGLPEGRSELNLRWSREDGRALMKALRRKLHDNAGLAKPASLFFFTGRHPWWHFK